MQAHDTDYCSFREIKAFVVTWNAGAATPTSLRYEERDSNAFKDILRASDAPDLLVFGFQELVDLEDKKLTASLLPACYPNILPNMPQKHFSKGARRRMLMNRNI